jgi:hypothetical protein
MIGQVSRQAGAIATGALNPNLDHLAMPTQPGQQPAITVRISRELLIGQQPPVPIDHRSMIRQCVCVDPTDDNPLHRCHA